METFGIKWQADASLLSKMFTLKNIEAQLNSSINIVKFCEGDLKIDKIDILFQTFKDLSLSKRETKAKLNSKRRILELTLEIDFDEISKAGEAESYDLLIETLLIGMVELVFVEGFDNFALSESIEAALSE